MTETGVVTVTTPEGKTIQLKSINALTSDISNRLVKDQNGADIPDKNAFVKNLGLVETVNKANNAVPSSRKINGKALSGDIDITSQDIFDGPITIPENADLNNYRTGGIYYQPSSAWAVTGKNYPQGAAGSLIVFRGGYTQRYSVIGSSESYIRGYYDTLGWSKWAQEYNTLNKPSAGDVGACRAYSGSINIGDTGTWTTDAFIAWLKQNGAFDVPYWMCKGSWSYASNRIITDTGCGNICLAGAVVEVMGTEYAMTIRVTTPTTTTGNGIPNAQFTYINHGKGYRPGWRRDYTKDEVDSLIVPVGAPILHSQRYTPKGYLYCNGQTFDKFRYPQLAAAYPDGKIPDLRGKFDTFNYIVRAV
ncbi:hypothetical protein B5C26_22755 [Photorhabdus luminescens]|nr:hypothetical protein B5C26_22755 [Photorhabdus luminescens]